MLLADMESENLIITSQVLAAAKHQYTVELARSSEDILEAQRLRYRVFAEEMGANLKPRIPGVDSDIYDPYCEHLIARDEAVDKIVGTYRILHPDAAARVGNY